MQLEIINISKSDAGGFKEVILVNEMIYSYLKYDQAFIAYKEYPRLKPGKSTHVSCWVAGTRGRRGDVQIGTQICE